MGHVTLTTHLQGTFVISGLGRTTINVGLSTILKVSVFIRTTRIKKRFKIWKMRWIMVNQGHWK